jgi:RimJ/RimL family protein N-acetyltransferase
MTDRPVTLRPVADGDLDVLFRIAAELDTWEERTPSPPAPLSRARFDERFAASERDGSSRDVRLIVDVDGEAVGSASLFDFDDLARHAELGISLVPEARGKGIGTAATSQMVEFGFVRRNLRRIHLEAIESNRAGVRAYEKAGFVVEGRLREHAWVRGRYEAIVLMGILRSEWGGVPGPLRD